MVMFSLRMRVLLFLLLAVPYAGLLVYTRFGVHSNAQYITEPPLVLLVALTLAGVFFPAASAVLTAKAIYRARDRLQLKELACLYMLAIAIFASGYSMAIFASVDPVFKGVPAVWTSQGDLNLGECLYRIHSAYLHMFYFSTITMATVGYGDITPLSGLTRFLTAAQSLCAVAFVGLVLGHYFSCGRGAEPKR